MANAHRRLVAGVRSNARARRLEEHLAELGLACMVSIARGEMPGVSMSTNSA